MVVDDEPRHRSGLIGLLQSIRPDYLLFEARDGEEAMRMLRTIGIEIVITDIRMPNMDGLALIEKIARKYPAIKTVILSVYGEFDYARKALDRGAFAYILKPVGQAEVEKLLHRLEVLIESQRKELTDRELMKQKLTETVLAYNNHLYNQLIRCQPEETMAVEVSHVASLDGPGMVVLFEVEGLPSARAREQQPVVRQKILEWVTATLRTFGETRTFELENSDSTLVALITAEREPDPALFDDLLESVVAEFGPVLSVSVSNAHENLLASAKKAFEEAFIALQFKFYNTSRTLYFRDINYNPFSIARDWYRDEERLALSIIGLDAEKTTCVFLEMIDEVVGSERPLPNSLKQRVTYIILEQLKRIGDAVSPEALEVLSSSLGRIHEHATDIDTLKDIVSTVIVTMVGELKRRRTTINFDVIEKCKAYIDSHYATDFSLDSVAELFHFNPSYFSTLFKSLSGSSFTDYLLAVRMSHAQELLANRAEKIIAISAKVGYRDPSYFARVFKRRFGLSPEEYRKRLIAQSISG